MYLPCESANAPWMVSVCAAHNTSYREEYVFISVHQRSCLAWPLQIEYALQRKSVFVPHTHTMHMNTNTHQRTHIDTGTHAYMNPNIDVHTSTFGHTALGVYTHTRAPTHIL